MKAKETHKMSDAELTEEVGRLRARLFELRTQAVTQKPDNPHQVSHVKRDIARVLTEQSARRQKQESTQ